MSFNTYRGKERKGTRMYLIDDIQRKEENKKKSIARPKNKMSLEIGICLHSINTLFLINWDEIVFKD